MAAIDILQQRNAKKIVEQKYIDRVLATEARNMFREQNKVAARFNVRSKVPEINRRRFTVSGGRLVVTHPIRQRFIDMKTIRGQRQRAIQIHNKIVYTHFNYIVNQMAYGFTQDVQNLIAQDLKIQL